jgi:hypothetical protein
MDKVLILLMTLVLVKMVFLINIYFKPLIAFNDLYF